MQKVGISYQKLIEENLCNTGITDGTLTAIIGTLMNYDAKTVQVFLNDISTFTAQNRNLLTDKTVQTWQYLYAKQADKAPNARKDWNTLVQFGQLNDNVKAEIVLFTDASATNSTLIEFCNDLKNTTGFIEFLNNPNHLIYANGFLGYRNDSQHNYKPEDYEVLTDEIVNLGISQTLQDMVGSWLDHAVDATNRNGYYKKGKDFENWIKGQFSSNTSATYQQLKTYFTTEGWNLDDYSIYSQVYFCINKSTTCTNEGSYFIADFVFVKEVTIGNTTILDVKIADTKLSSGTVFTTNQKDAMNLIPSPFYIRSFKPQDLIKGVASNLFQVGKQVPNQNTFYKIYSGGTPNTYGGTKK